MSDEPTDDGVDAWREELARAELPTREIYECHDCYGNDDDCDRCLGSNRVCSLCEHGACGAHQVKTDGHLPYRWSEACTASEIEDREAERDAKETEFQRKRQERLSARRDALCFARGVLRDRRHELEVDHQIDQHTLVRYDDAITVLEVWIEELTQ